ncbi:ABC transporter ATP-binding protein [Endozoicomonas sp. Mp262]|uniref:ABC transporter ATP-binding protein n=1 Tax=Endozoicomonas sp. Mp262 TaxID=2919499 RepID=UPI0021E06979
MSFSITNLNFGYRNQAVLKNISINNLQPGQFVGVLGANGAGKSTLFKCIADTLKPASGEMMLSDTPLETFDKNERIRKICYMPQHFQSNAALTVFDVVMLARKFSIASKMGKADINQVASTLDMLQIEHLANRNISELSGGQQQMVSLAQAIIRSPELLLLDEPTSALDLQKQLEVMDLIRQFSHQRQIITMVAIHDLNLAARFADQLILMSNGTVQKTGTPIEVLTPEAILAIYGVKAAVRHDSDNRPVISAIESTRKLSLGF